MKHLVCVFILICTIYSQKNSNISYSFYKPNFEYFEDFTFASGNHRIDFDFPVTSNYRLNLIVPIHAYFFDSEEGEKVRFGNISFYFMKMKEGKSYYRLGASLPTGSDMGFSWFLATFTDFYNYNLYSPNYLTLHAEKINSYEFNKNIVGITLGTKIFIPTGDTNDDTEVILNYDFTYSRILVESFNITTGLEGLFNISNSDLEFDDRFVNQWKIGLDVNISRDMTLAVLYKLPLENMFKKVVNNIMQLNFQMNL